MNIIRRYFKGIFICGLIIFASLFAFRYAFFKTYKKFIEYAELTYVASKNKQLDKRNSEAPQLQNLIAHAGGGVNNLSLLNSLEALNLSYSKGFRFIELDFEWTTDGNLVLIHDWQERPSQLFNAPQRRYSLKEYNSLRMINGMTNLALDDLAKWIRQHPDAFIITDVKRNNIRALTMIKERFPDLVGNFIPQIYYFREYLPVKELGYRQVILTLYVAAYSDEAVLRFAKGYPLVAVTMPVGRASTDLPLGLKRLGVATYAHTVNSVSVQHKLYANGVFGVYTDFLAPLNED